MRITLLFSFLIIATFGFGQGIPQSRLFDWSSAGLTTEKAPKGTLVDFVARGGLGDGTTANDSVMSAILNASLTDSLIITFPSGVYYFEHGISLPTHTTLVGTSIDSTTLLFDRSGTGHLIAATGQMGSDSAVLSANAFKGQRNITVVNPSLFTAGEHIKLIDDDSAVVTSHWARYSTGQFTRIDSVSGNQIYLAESLRRNYAMALGAVAIKVAAVTDVGIQSLKIERVDATTAQTSNIRFNYAYDCWIKCIESDKGNFAHVEISNSDHIEVSGSYFHDAFAYGGGGKGYGVVLQFGTSNTLVRNNTFEHLRHSMLLQAGPNGNVLAYNYSTDPFWTGTFLPSDAAGDLVLHGNYPYANLFEGNTVQTVVIDDSHGANGPFNTFFRNRAELYGITMSSASAGDSLTIVANEITGTGFLKGNYITYGAGNLEAGNNKNGTVQPVGTVSVPDTTLFYDSIPDYYQTNSNWPPIGLPVPLNTHKIENETLFANGINSPCQDNQVVLSVQQVEREAKRLTLYPNPTVGSISLDGPIGDVSAMALYSLDGQLLLSRESATDLDLSHLSAGIYILKVTLRDGFVENHKVLRGR